MSATAMEFEFTPEDFQKARFMRLGKKGTGLAVPHFGEDEAYPRVWDINALVDRPEATWLIKNVVEDKGLTIFFGADKTAKTAMLSNFLWAWCAGQDDFLTRDFTMKGENRTVLYVLLEGQQNFYSRYHAWCVAYNDGEPVEGFYVVDEGLSLFDEGMNWEKQDTWTMSAKKLWNAIAALEPGILVIDTLSRATAGMNENSSSMAHVVGVLDHMRDVFDLSTVIVHHVSLDKATADRPRGHSSLKGAASSYVRITGKPEDEILYLRTGPHRNSDQYRKIPFTRSPVEASFVIKPVEPKMTLSASLLAGAPMSVDVAAHQLYGEMNATTRKRVRSLVQNHPLLMMMADVVSLVASDPVNEL